MVLYRACHFFVVVSSSGAAFDRAMPIAMYMCDKDADISRHMLVQAHVLGVCISYRMIICPCYARQRCLLREAVYAGHEV